MLMLWRERERGSSPPRGELPSSSQEHQACATVMGRVRARKSDCISQSAKNLRSCLLRQRRRRAEWIQMPSSRHTTWKTPGAYRMTSPCVSTSGCPRTSASGARRSGRPISHSLPHRLFIVCSVIVRSGMTHTRYGRKSAADPGCPGPALFDVGRPRSGGPSGKSRYVGSNPA